MEASRRGLASPRKVALPTPADAVEVNMTKETFAKTTCRSERLNANMHLYADVPCNLPVQFRACERLSLSTSQRNLRFEFVAIDTSAASSPVSWRLLPAWSRIRHRSLAPVLFFADASLHGSCQLQLGKQLQGRAPVRALHAGRSQPTNMALSAPGAKRWMAQWLCSGSLRNLFPRPRLWDLQLGAVLCNADGLLRRRSCPTLPQLLAPWLGPKSKETLCLSHASGRIQNRHASLFCKSAVSEPCGSIMQD